MFPSFAHFPDLFFHKVTITFARIKIVTRHPLLAMNLECLEAPIKNVLLDINGVLFESGEEGPIKGSVEAVSK